MQFVSYWHGNDCIACGSVCDGVHAMKVSMILMALLALVAVANATVYMGYMIGELIWQSQVLM